MIANFNEIKSIKSFNILFDLLKLININISNPLELNNLTIDRTLLIKSDLNNSISGLQDRMKGLFHSSYLTCLHSNSQLKQKYPFINLLRQILKCLGYSMTPKVINLGYDKKTGRKLTKRFFTIKPLV